MVFALERKLADALEIAFVHGFRPWWSRTREASWTWRTSAKTDWVSAPEGFSPLGGWWTAVSGVVSALPALGCGVVEQQTQSESQPSHIASFNSMWTKAKSQIQLGGERKVKSIVFPAEITAFGGKALKDSMMLESVVFPAGCTVFGKSAFYGCRSLKFVSLPARARQSDVGPSTTAFRSLT
jgi:hypothetical protein